MSAPTPAPDHRDSRYLTDGGLETTLVFLDGMELPDFACFPLLGSEDGQVPPRPLLPCPTSTSPSAPGRASCSTPPPGGPTATGVRGSGCDAVTLAEVNRRAVEYAAGLAQNRSVPVVINGVIGPRGDGYVVGETMTADEAASLPLAAGAARSRRQGRR